MHYLTKYSVLFIACFFWGHVHAQTVGLISHLSGSEDDGYVLFSPLYADSTYLVDKCGRCVHKWAADYTPGADFYLLNDGTLLRSGNYPNPVFSPSNVSAGGIVQRFNWGGDLLWQYVISNAMETQNHDICYLPNGNILAAVWEVISDSEAIANGKNPTYLPASGLWSAKVVEIQPVGADSGNVVWQWRVWDHLIQDYDSTKLNYGVVADHPELLNLNFIDYTYDPTSYTSDWLHFNAVTYNPDLNQIMVSAHNLSEIWIIDHSTDSLQAKSHIGGTHNKGGDFLYRWGNPQVYDRGTAADQKLFQQHDPTWITEGKYVNQIMIFNNGLGRPGGNASSVDIINQPVDSSGNYLIDSGAAYGPTGLSWSYEASPVPESFLSSYMGGAQILPSSNILICDAMSGTFFEIDSNKNVVWKYINPVNNGVPVAQGTSVSLNSVYRCTFYQSSYAGFLGDTFPEDPIPVELNPLPYTCELGILKSNNLSSSGDVFSIFPNPANDNLSVNGTGLKSVEIFDITGRCLLSKSFNETNSAELNVAEISPGVYIICINGNQYQQIAVLH